MVDVRVHRVSYVCLTAGLSGASEYIANKKVVWQVFFSCKVQVCAAPVSVAKFFLMFYFEVIGRVLFVPGSAIYLSVVCFNGSVQGAPV